MGLKFWHGMIFKNTISQSDISMIGDDSTGDAKYTTFEIIVNFFSNIFVSKITGKGLSTNDYDNEAIALINSKVDRQTLVSITTEPNTDFADDSKYYNSTNKKIYTLDSSGGTWGNPVTPIAGVIYIFGGKNYLWDGTTLYDSSIPRIKTINGTSLLGTGNVGIGLPTLAATTLADFNGVSDEGLHLITGMGGTYDAQYKEGILTQTVITGGKIYSRDINFTGEQPDWSILFTEKSLNPAFANKIDKLLSQFLTDDEGNLFLDDNGNPYIIQ